MPVRSRNRAAPPTVREEPPPMVEATRDDTPARPSDPVLRELTGGELWEALDRDAPFHTFGISTLRELRSMAWAHRRTLVPYIDIEIESRLSEDSDDLDEE